MTASLEELLSSFSDPAIGPDLLASGVVRNAVVAENSIEIQLMLGFAAGLYRVDLAKRLTAHIQQHLDVPVNVHVDWEIASHVRSGVSAIPNIKNLIAIGSGKGGVGKSTVSVNVALALAQEGARVGILDADIYGPSQPRMLGISGKPNSPDGQNMYPMVAHNIQSMSIGYLIDEEQPMVWRGPMATQALTQLIQETKWDDLDYLIIDMPPGTGDIQLTLSQRVPLAGAVIVTTPQDIALLDARKGLRMFQKVEVPVLGIVENMSTHVCSNCGHEEAIFGEGGGAQMAQDYDVYLLGQLPLSKTIREQADSGNPTVAAQPESELASRYRQIACTMAGRLAHGSTAEEFPTIEISDD